MKICGITREEDLEMVVDLGADAVGFITGFPSSPRNLTVERVRRLLQIIPPFVTSVVVTPSDSASLKKIKTLKPGALQLYGHPPSHRSLRSLFPGVHLIKPVHVHSERRFESTLKASKNYDAVLLDSFVKGKVGGTGVIHDWELSAEIRRSVHPTPVILSGGLDSGNVARAISIVKPFAVDVSTRVEASPGVKDPDKVKCFIEAVRRLRYD